MTCFDEGDSQNADEWNVWTLSTFDKTRTAHIFSTLTIHVLFIAHGNTVNELKLERPWSLTI